MAKRKVIKKAPLNKRIFAFLIDWYFGWVFALGKKFLSLKITNENGETLNAKDLAKRQIVGLLLLESPLMLAGNYVTQMITMYTFDVAGTVLNWVKVAILIISCYMVVKKGTAIHDIISHSMVIEK